MVSQVVLLHLGHVLRQPCVVKGIVHAVVEDVERECSCDNSVGDRLGEQSVAELCERVGKDKEEEGRHDETKSEIDRAEFRSAESQG